MKKISFAEKNNFILMHKHEKHFEKDLILFRSHFPNSKLNTDLSRANIFTRARLDGLMLMELLTKVDIEDILKHRNAEPVSEGTVIPPVVDPTKTDDTKGTIIPPVVDPTKSVIPEGEVKSTDPEAQTQSDDKKKEANN